MRKVLTTAVLLSLACAREAQPPQAGGTLASPPHEPLSLAQRTAIIDAATAYRHEWLLDTVRIDYCAAVEALDKNPENLRLLALPTRSVLTPEQSWPCEPGASLRTQPYAMVVDSFSQSDSTIVLTALVARGEYHRWEAFALDRKTMGFAEHRLSRFKIFVGAEPQSGTTVPPPH